MFRISSICLSAFFATTAFAQDNPNTILVMDGSGSMWGQIDGVAKITIAQDVVSNLMDTIPADQNVGLTVYGHRERGNCTDIETIVAPGPDTRGAIRNAVNAIKPLGKTPMTDSIIAAAEALRYTEDSATVILVSDGVETCNPDPCAAMRLLEEAAIDFTAHVVGFDVGSDAAALSQMQCIADETGGQFLTADNAEELGQALQAVAVEPEPAILPYTFTAVVGDDKRVLKSPVLWDINSDAGMVGEDMEGNPLTVEISEGSYVATAYSLELEQTVNVDFVVRTDAAAMVEAVFEEPAMTAALTAPDTVPGGSTFQVGWTGPDDQNDNIQIGNTGESGYFDYVYTRDGNPVSFIAPFQPGTYELRYVLRDQETIGTRLIDVTEVEVALTGPDSVTVGSVFDVAWTGPDALRDNVQIGETNANSYNSYSYTERSNPVSLTAPATPGEYELRYVFRDREIVYRQPITVVEANSQLQAPDTAPLGSSVTVGWDGPDNERDFISVGEVGEDQYINYTYTSAGNPLELLMPTEVGDYEIRYQLREDSEIIARRPITITGTPVTLDVPAEAVLGSLATISWTGPGYERDYLSVAELGSNQYINYTYVSEGSPLTLMMPTEPGDYEVRYQLRQDGVVLASAPITVTEADVSVSAPLDAPAGSTVNVDWSGPDFERDFISVAEVGERNYINYTYTASGNPLALELPPVPGNYEIRYQLRQDSKVMATTPITVTPLKVTLSGPANAKAGELVEVTWDGPGYDRDFISVAEVGSNQYINYTYASEGNPLEVEMPATPGTYEIRYQLRQDNQVVARQQVVVEPLKVQLAAPATVSLGETLMVGWDGPDYARDFIAISKADEPKSYLSYTYTNAGNPVELHMPEEAGDYEIRYYLRQGNTIVARSPLTITE